MILHVCSTRKRKPKNSMECVNAFFLHISTYTGWSLITFKSAGGKIITIAPIIFSAIQNGLLGVALGNIGRRHHFSFDLTLIPFFFLWVNRFQRIVCIVVVKHCPSFWVLIADVQLLWLGYFLRGTLFFGRIGGNLYFCNFCGNLWFIDEPIVIETESFLKKQTI